MQELLLRPLPLKLLIGRPPTPPHFTVDVFPEHNDPWQNRICIIWGSFFPPIFYLYVLRNLSGNTFSFSASIFLSSRSSPCSCTLCLVHSFHQTKIKKRHILLYSMNKIQFSKSLHCLFVRICRVVSPLRHLGAVSGESN